MKINFLLYQPNFKGRREDRNNVNQLRVNNSYSLTDPNQRRISESIENLGKYSGDENLNFILDVANNLQYGTNIENGKSPKNDWKMKLKGAAEKVLNISNPSVKEKYQSKFDEIFNMPQKLTEDEKAILEYKKLILKNSDLKSLECNKNENIKSLEKNLDYFIKSSETTTAQKLYILKRLDYMMSPNYEINPQLKDKKTQVLAEIMNDLAINTKDSKIPNIKAINQKSFGMCAGISMARKALAYEDKPNYVDAILSELDSSDSIMVYDRFNLGSGKRVPVKKAHVDYDYAQAKGYRIVDAAVTNWMNIADMYGINNENMASYNSFDKLNFDAFQDSHFMTTFDDNELMRKQCHYQALVKAQYDIASYKSLMLRRNIAKKENNLNKYDNLELVSKYNDLIKKELHKVLPKFNEAEIRELSLALSKLEKPTSEKIANTSSELKPYSFIPNEEYAQKVKKVKQYIIDKTQIKDTETLQNVVRKVVGLIGEVNALSYQINGSSRLSTKVALARKAYASEAIYRASVLLGLNERDILTDNLIKYNIPDRETRISKALGQMIVDLQMAENDDVVEYFSKMFNLDKPDKDAVVKNINIIKENFDDNITNRLDGLYRRLGLGNRKEVLFAELEETKALIKSGNKAEQLRLSELLGIENSKKATLTAIENFEKRLSSPNYNEKTYIDIINKLGYKSQNDMYVERFQDVVDMISNPHSPGYEENIKVLKSLNNFPQEAADQEFIQLISQTGLEFNEISQDIELAAQVVEMYTELMTNKGVANPLTVEAKSLVLREMENHGELIRESVMKKLQDRFTKIDNVKSADEFSVKHGKFSEPELYKLTKEESDAIKQINKKINSMYSDVVRRLNNQFREIRPQLEELNRYVYTNMGEYSSRRDGRSSLTSEQQVKIFEQITDRPYYAEENLETAADLILNGPYSGISGTSVYHDSIGGHAQYIADIKKVGPQQKYAIFHDNTWGASEHENTWVDSEGLTRTDYNDGRGGELGYITDEDWRNGNYIENIINKKGHVNRKVINNKNYKKLNPGNNEEFDFRLLWDVVINGKNPELKTIAGQIKDTIYLPETIYLKDFGKLLSQMTQEEVEKKILGREQVRKSYKQRFEEIMKRIESTPFYSGINSKEDYAKLSDNDPVKIQMEKVATKLANPNFYMAESLAKAKTLPEIENIRKILKENAVKDFYYAFSKDEENLLYYAFEKSRDVSRKLIDILDENGIKYENGAIPKIFSNTAIYEKNEKLQFNGSLKDTINFVVNKTLKQFDENIPSDEKSQKARKEFKEVLVKTLNDSMYFNLDDIQSDKFRAKSIRKWLDRKFDPASDEEFVQIYRKLQDMTTEEFNKYTQDLSDEDIGIKSITGYDVITKLKSANSKVKMDLRNSIYYEELLKVFKYSKTEPSYKYQKNQRSLRSAVYKNGRTFDDLYRSYVNTLDLLDYEKMFNKYKDVNFREHKILPAYPKIDLVAERDLNYKISSIEQFINQGFTAVNMRKSLLNTINLINNLDNYVKGLSPDKIPSRMEYLAINRMLGEFITSNYNDTDASRALDVAYEMLQFSPKEPIKKYQEGIATMVEEYQTAVKLNEETSLKEANIEDIKSIKKYLNLSMLYNIPPKYENIVREDLNNWIDAEFKKKDYTLSNRLSEFEVRGKLLEYGISSKNKISTNKFTEIIKILNEIQIAKAEKLYDESRYASAHAKVDKLVQDIVTGCIKPEFQNHAKKVLKAWIDAELGKTKRTGYDADEAEIAKAKFAEDFKKYNYANNPQEVFKSYIRSHVKDSKTADYQNYFESLLIRHVNNSILVDIQDLLMSAVQTGNAAEVKDYFKDYYVNPYGSPLTQTMDSAESISYMVKSLMMNYNEDTAKMFVEKLGLAEKFIDFESEEFDIFDLDEKVKSILNIVNETRLNMLIINTEVYKLCQIIDGAENFEKLIDDTKANIIKKTKKNSRQSDIKICLEALDNAKARLIKTPGLKPSLLINQYIDNAVATIAAKSNEESKKHQEFLNIVITLYSFIARLDLPEYSEAYQKQQVLTKKFEDFKRHYEKSLTDLQKTCSNVKVSGLSTGN